MRLTLTSTLVLLFIAVIISVETKANCRIRKEIRDLTAQERKALIDGFMEMYKDGSLHRLYNLHLNNLKVAHKTQYFLLWHRAFMLEAEDELLRHTTGLSGLPYLDLTKDASNPDASPSFGTDLFLPLGEECLFGIELNGQCLKRQKTKFNWGQCADTVVAEMIHLYSNYEAISRAVETTCHNLVHASFAKGSQLYFTQSSAIDPFFYPMHAGTDFFFATWQLKHSDYSGVSLDTEFLGHSAAELFAYSEGPRCYRYPSIPTPEEKPADLPAAPTSSSETILPSVHVPQEIPQIESKSNQESSSFVLPSPTPVSIDSRPKKTPKRERPAASTEASASNILSPEAIASNVPPTSTNQDSSSTFPIPQSTPAEWIPEFERIPDEWFNGMPGMFTKEEIEQFNRIAANAIKLLQRLKAEGKPLPSMKDFQHLEPNHSWTIEGIKKSNAQKPATGSTGKAAANSSSVTLTLVSTVTTIAMSIFIVLTL